jgi:hypothetical protein
MNSESGVPESLTYPSGSRCGDPVPLPKYLRDRGWIIHGIFAAKANAEAACGEGEKILTVHDVPTMHGWKATEYLVVGPPRLANDGGTPPEAKGGGKDA